MAAQDAYGNPGFVATDELIESAWGNAVVSTAVRRYPTFAAWLAANPAPTDGQTFAIGPNLFVVRGGRLVSVSDQLTTVVGITAGNVAAGGATVQLPGSLGLFVNPWDVRYLVMWHGFGGGHGYPGDVSATIRDSASPSTVYGSTGPYQYTPGNSPSWLCLAQITVPANTSKALTFWTTINGSAANLNVSGGATAIGVPV